MKTARRSAGTRPPFTAAATLRVAACIALLAGPVLADAATVSVSPNSGAGGRPVQLTTSGFDLDNVGYNTGFYVNGGFVGACPPDNRANCTIAIKMPATSGTALVEARNSAGESGSDYYTVVAPTVVIMPACGAPGTEVTVTGRFFAVGFDAGIYFGGSLVANFNYPDDEGTFSRTITVPAAATGEYDLRAANSAGNTGTRTFSVVETGCAVVGEVTELKGGGLGRQLPDGSIEPLSPGAPIRQNDVITGLPDAGGKGGGRILLQDNTEFVVNATGTVRVDDFSFDPVTHEGRGGFSMGGFFRLLSGLMVTTPDKRYVQATECCYYAGIRGTHIVGKAGDDAGTADLYLLEGAIDVQAWTVGIPTAIDAPAAVRITAAGVTPLPFEDGDGDGVPDPVDNCTARANADQGDTNGDDYGNACDGDLDDSGAVNAGDLALLRIAFGSNAASPNWNPHADFNGSGSVNAADLAIFRTFFGVPPGPSGLAP